MGKRYAEELLRTGVSFLVEANFTPEYADPRWQRLAAQYGFNLIQVRCEADGKTLLHRYRARITSGERHLGHVDGSDDAVLQALLDSGPPGWLAVPGEQISIDTTMLTTTTFQPVTERLQQLLVKEGAP